MITMTFLTSLKQFLHLLVGPNGLFSSLRVTNKYLIDGWCCAAAGLQPTRSVIVAVFIKKLLFIRNI